MRTCIATLAMVWTLTALHHSSLAEDNARWLPITLEDGSQLNAVLADDVIPLQTQYGLLAIPSQEVRRIAFAVRPSDEQAARITAAIEALERDPQAKATLIQAGELALPALFAAAHAGHVERTAHIRDVIAAIAAAHKGPLFVRDCDVIHTAQGTIRGTITLPALKIRTRQFGLLMLNLADARSIGAPLAAGQPIQWAQTGKRKAQPSPGHLSDYADRIGERFIFEVTGANRGSVWGTDIYTSDSDLEAAAVHAGVLRIGQTGVVEVEIVAPLAAYQGSTRHGIVTYNYGPYDGAYRVRKATQQLPVRLFQWWQLR